MSFLRHDMPNDPKDAILFDREGGTHVKGRSTRVSQQPGGNSSLSLGFGNFGKENEPPQRRGRAAVIPPSDPPRTVEPEPVKPPPPKMSEPSVSPSKDYTPLWCNEGSQVRTRPARKVVQPPGGASSIIF
eukprot:NODE_9691_length_571_cov_82.787946_g9054_i0.p1 GENE.NODE_9691_length_571_cov_82.787946_g9054_i0~~NODE_9691_length_571_cov_82.787946_g9054_i0.p1  ORF type:complete len:130 (-),score=21.58 NODE_9691_length_571_cov_82.787946_g9054_i0:138-527(-)